MNSQQPQDTSAVDNTEEQKPPEQAVAQETPKEETPEEINWKKYRNEQAERRVRDKEEKETAQREAAQAKAQAEALKAALEATLGNEQLSNQALPETQPNPLNPTEIPTGEQVMGYTQRVVKEQVQAALAEQQRKHEAELAEKERNTLGDTMVEHYSDFNTVCTTENIDYLAYKYPEVAAPFNGMADNAKKWGMVYKAIKRFVPNNDGQKEKAIAESNLNRPQSVSSAGVAQTGDQAPASSHLTDSRKQENYARMQKILRGG